MLKRYEHNSFSDKFLDADIHWHLWNEVIEKMKSIDIHNEDEMKRFTIERIKRDILNSMIKCGVVSDDYLDGVLYLMSTLCVLCVLNRTCDTCPLGRCYAEGRIYSNIDFYMSEARDSKRCETRDYVATKKYIDKTIELAKEVRDILCSTGK